MLPITPSLHKNWYLAWDSNPNRSPLKETYNLSTHPGIVNLAGHVGFEPTTCELTAHRTSRCAYDP